MCLTCPPLLASYTHPGKGEVQSTLPGEGDLLAFKEFTHTYTDIYAKGHTQPLTIYK